MITCHTYAYECIISKTKEDNVMPVINSLITEHALKTVSVSSQKLFHKLQKCRAGLCGQREVGESLVKRVNTSGHWENSASCCHGEGHLNLHTQRRAW